MSKPNDYGNYCDMKLSTLLKNCDPLNPSTVEAIQSDVVSITDDSRAIVPGSVFFCVVGNKFDGRIL